MSEGSAESGNTGHHRQKPVTLVSAMVVDRLVLRLSSVVGLMIIMLVWLALTRTGLGFGGVCIFSPVAVAIRELTDASAHRFVIRAWHSRGPHGLLLTIVAATYPAITRFPVACLLAPVSTTALTALTWLLLMAFAALIKRSWDTSLRYDVLRERIHQPQPIPLEYVTANFHGARKYSLELRRVAQTYAAL